MDLNTTNLVPEVKHFGPYRVIGMSCTDQRYSELWGAFLPRKEEIESPAPDAMMLGMSRCLPDGSQEYIAAIPVTADCPVPDGMIEAIVGDATYAVITVKGIDQIGRGWSAMHEWLGETSEWQSYCVKDSNGVCGCTDYPCFELYPADHAQTNLVYIYVPIRHKA